MKSKKALSTDIGEYCTVISWQDLAGDKYAADNTGKDPRTAKSGDRPVRIGPWIPEYRKACMEYHNR